MYLTADYKPQAEQALQSGNQGPALEFTLATPLFMQEVWLSCSTPPLAESAPNFMLYLMTNFPLSTVEYMTAGTVPPNWPDIFKYSTELATNKDFNLAETWLDQNYNHQFSADSKSADSSITDPFAVVPDQPTGDDTKEFQERIIPAPCQLLCWPPRERDQHRQTREQA